MIKTSSDIYTNNDVVRSPSPVKAENLQSQTLSLIRHKIYMLMQLHHYILANSIPQE